MKDGGPAFPVAETQFSRDGDHVDSWLESTGGMSIRDYFAAASLLGYRSGGWTAHEPHTIAKFAYQDADALLAEREKNVAG